MLRFWLFRVDWDMSSYCRWSKPVNMLQEAWRLVDDPAEHRARVVVDLPVVVAACSSVILSFFFRRHALKERGQHIVVRERRARSQRAKCDAPSMPASRRWSLS